jgi:hypothetical protein
MSGQQRRLQSATSLSRVIYTAVRSLSHFMLKSEIGVCVVLS